MKNIPQPNKNVSDADAESALNAALRLSASVFPQTDEDIEALQSETDATLAPTPNVLKFKKLLSEDGGSPKPVEKVRLTKFEIPEISENWAIAARNGAQITPEVRAKMDAARAAAKKKPST